MRKIRIGLVVLVASVVLLWTGVARAGTDPVVKCQVNKFKAAGKRASSLAKEKGNDLPPRSWTPS